MKSQRTAVRQLASFICVLFAVTLAGCVSQRTASRSAAGKLVQEADQYASTLKSQDKLPGYGSSEHGRVIASAPWNGGEVSYPASVHVRAWKNGDKTTYCYDFVKDNPQSDWQLTKATHLGKHNNLIDQLYPK